MALNIRAETLFDGATNPAASNAPVDVSMKKVVAGSSSVLFAVTVKELSASSWTGTWSEIMA